MAVRGLIEDRTTDDSVVSVQIPYHEKAKCQITGRVMQTLLLSLAKQIKTQHMERRVERFTIDKQSMRIIIQFEREEET